MRCVALSAFRAGLPRIDDAVVVAKHTGRRVQVLGVWQPAPRLPGPPDPLTIAIVDVVGEVRPVLVRAVRALYLGGEMRPIELAVAVGRRPASAYALTKALSAWIRSRQVPGAHYRQTSVALSESTRAAIAAKLEETNSG